MTIKQRIDLISALTLELSATAKRYNEVKEKKGYANAGYEISLFESKTAIQRRITVLREELLELSKSL